MAKRSERTSQVTLPWEPRTGLLRDLLSGRRVRLVPVALGAVLAVSFVADHAIARHDLSRTRDVIDDTHRAVARFRADMGRCPSTIRELVHPPRSGAHYLPSEPVDAWGRALWVRCPGRYDPDGEDVVSAGPSGNFLSDTTVW
jgi:hypothetical protein